MTNLNRDLTILEIIKYGHPVLHKKAEDVLNIDDDLVRLAKNMIRTMHAAPGIGLAAPQVNQSLRLITVDLSLGEDSEAQLVLINPKILEREGEIVSEEGCLSVPGITEKVSRPARICVRGITLDEQEVTLEAKDLLARVLCHEIDHLDGKLFIEHLSQLKRNLAKKKLKKSN